MGIIAIGLFAEPSLTPFAGNVKAGFGGLLVAALSSVVVKVGVYGLIRLTMLLFIAEAPLVRTVLLILGIIDIFFGGLAALRTYDAKRMLAYPTFDQIGFILLDIGRRTPLALIGAIVYSFNHSFIKSSLLMLTGAIASRMGTISFDPT